MGNEEMIRRQLLENTGTTEAQDNVAQALRQEDKDSLNVDDVIATDDFYGLLSEAIGPDAWDNKVHEESLIDAIMKRDWLEVGRIVGEPAREYMAKVVMEGRE